MVLVGAYQLILTISRWKVWIHCEIELNVFFLRKRQLSLLYEYIEKYKSQKNE